MTVAMSPSAVAVVTSTAPELEALGARLQGALITPESAQYDPARKVQVVFDRYPKGIVRAAGAQDVAETVLFCRRRGLPLAVRSGGHSIPGHSMVDDAIVVDLSAMRSVTIDPERRIARAQAGATSGDLATPAHAYGLALSTGDTATVGLGGLTTGGGIGYMVRKHGLAIDNLLSAQVVTADGRVVTASPDEHPDLFWAIRGGGGNFGIITEFEFRLAPVGQVLAGALVLPATREVIRGYLEYTASAPDDLTAIADLMKAPPAPFIPEERVGEPVLFIIACWAGDVEEGERALAPLRALATPVGDTIEPIPYPVIYDYSEEAAQPHLAEVRSMYAHDLSDETIDATLRALETATSPFCMVQFRGLGGALNRVPADATAFGHRDKQYLVAVLGLWMDPEEDRSTHAAWADSLWSEIRHESAGVYVNFLGQDGPARLGEAYPEATLRRLEQIKAKYDPDNLFRFNQNITPRR